MKSTETARASQDCALNEAYSLAKEETFKHERAELVALRAELESVEREMWDNKVRRADLTARLRERDRWILEVRTSPVWKLMRPLWKLQRHFSRREPGPSRNPGCSELISAIDPREVSALSSTMVTVTGWCFAHGGPEIVGIRAKVGRKSYFARYGLKRVEVMNGGEYPGALYAGFSLTIPVNSNSRVRLEAISQGGVWQCFCDDALKSDSVDREGSSIGKNSENREGLRPAPAEVTKNPELVLFPGIGIKEVPVVLAPRLAAHRKRAVSEGLRFSVVTCLFDAEPRWIAEACASLCGQTLPDWEWIVVGPASSENEVHLMLELLATEFKPFLRLTVAQGAGPSSALNQALDCATGEFICFLDEKDLLAPDALAAISNKFDESFDLVYSDEDKLDDIRPELVEPFCKPQWSPEYFRGVLYMGHLLSVRRELASKVRFDSTFDGVQSSDFVLRVSETGARIGHVPEILYHARKTAQLHPSSRADSVLEARAVTAHLERVGLAARAAPGLTSRRLRIIPAPRRSFPKISIVIPTKDSPDLLSQCLHTLYDRTEYPRFEVLLVDNDTSDAAALAIMSNYPVLRVSFPDPFNYSRANNLGARHATGEYLLFLNNDTEVISSAWLEHLLYYAEQPDIGAAGALLLHENGEVQHAGVVIGMGGTADHAMRGFNARSDGYAGSLSCAREVSAVTAACMMMRKSLFFELGGFNEQFLTIYQDVDLCLRVREKRLRIIWTPHARLLHHESVSRQQSSDVADRRLLLEQWQHTIARGDPYYNPNLDLDRADYSLGRSRCPLEW